MHGWYLGVYIDAFEWVELPNTLGMSQFADGGMLATKPYVSSAAYIDRMSDYCKGCHYDKKRAWASGPAPSMRCTGIFSRAMATTPGGQPALGMVYRQLEKMDAAAIAAFQARAQAIMARLDDL